jgi:hypothetical protein
VLTVFGVGLDAVLRDTAAGNKQQFASVLDWWPIDGADFRGWTVKSLSLSSTADPGHHICQA